MKKKTGNLAIVSNSTFAASESVNLKHYDISSALQTTLEFNELVTIFSSKIQQLVPHNGFSYENEEFNLEIQQGIVTQHSCSYILKVEDMQLGSLKLMRQQRFDKKEIKLLETLLCFLIYPLKNATLLKQALNMAYTDPLTKTNNRASLNDSLQREIKLAHRRSNPLSIAFIDLDHFKKINDEFGHECGDVALASAANCINEAVRGSDLVFRYGGEEFVIIFSDTNLEGAEIITERIRRSIESHVVSYNMKAIKLTASLGVSSLRANDDSTSLTKRADGAMYCAKQKGRNQVQVELTELVN